MEIRFLGAHNAESKKTRLSSLIIDNILAVDAGSLSSELSFSEQEKIKAILLTHGHYDHIRAIPAFAFNNRDHTTNVYALPETFNILSSHLVDGVIYPKFTEKIPYFLEKPSLKFVPLEPFIPTSIIGYHVLALPVRHTINAVGFQIISKNGKQLFYSGDTGFGLSALWEHVTPDLLILEATFPNRFKNRAINAAHLCPNMINKELKDYYRIKGHLPKVYLTHLSAKHEAEIKKEIKKIEKELEITIFIASEGEKVII